MTTAIIAYPEATTWLFATLTTPPISGIADRVFEIDAPEEVTNAGELWIDFEAQAPGEDAAEVAEQRIWTEYAFLVRVVGRGRSTAALKTIALAIDARLHRANGTTTDGQVISSVRTQEAPPDKWLLQGVEYRSLGGFYNLIVQSLHP